MLTIIALTLFSIAVYLFILFIVKRDRGHREPIEALFIALGFGVLAIILAGVLNSIFVPSEVMDQVVGPADAPSLPKIDLFTAALTVGFIEETVKCIPLAIFIYKRKYFDELTDGVIYFGIAALTFGILEDISYTLQFGGAVGISRILFIPYLHAGFAILFGLSLAYKKVLKKSWLLVLFGYISAIMAHAIFDYFAFSGGIIANMAILSITLSLNILLFVFFRKAQRGDEARGQSTIGINKYCRHCGRPNPKQLLYCTFCGKLS